MTMFRIVARPLQFGGYLLLAACAAIPGGDRATYDNPWGHKTEASEAPVTSSVRQPRPEGQPLRHEPAATPSAAPSGPRAEIYRGSGNMIELGTAPRQPVDERGRSP